MWEKLEAQAAKEGEDGQPPHHIRKTISVDSGNEASSEDSNESSVKVEKIVIIADLDVLPAAAADADANDAAEAIEDAGECSTEAAGASKSQMEPSAVVAAAASKVSSKPAENSGPASSNENSNSSSSIVAERKCHHLDTAGTSR